MQSTNSKIVDDLKEKRAAITAIEEAITLNKTQGKELGESFRLAVKQFNRLVAAYPAEASLAEVKAIAKPAKGDAAAPAAEAPAAQ